MRLILIFIGMWATTMSLAQTINYSPAYFGPNANPVPVFCDATIAPYTTINLSNSYYFGLGDNTSNFDFAVEIPLLPKFVSFKIWTPFIENYKVTDEIFNHRKMIGDKTGTIAIGDIYVQTRILITKEKKIMPAIILNTTLKTASGDNFEQRRYFDTPGYYFDMEFGKLINLSNSIVNKIRTVANIGFFCWETTNSTQNDAFMYGAKIILSNRLFDFENTLSGYTGWMKNGDAPLIFYSKMTYKTQKYNFFAKYQYGINDFPYRHMQIGTAFVLQKLTPRFAI